MCVFAQTDLFHINTQCLALKHLILFLYFFLCFTALHIHPLCVFSFMHVCIRVCRDIWSLGCVLYELCTLRHPVSILSPIILLVLIQRLIPQLSLSWCFSNSGACPAGTGGRRGHVLRIYFFSMSLFMLKIYKLKYIKYNI